MAHIGFEGFVEKRLANGVERYVLYATPGLGLVNQRTDFLGRQARLALGVRIGHVFPDRATLALEIAAIFRRDIHELGVLQALRHLYGPGGKYVTSLSGSIIRLKSGITTRPAAESRQAVVPR